MKQLAEKWAGYPVPQGASPLQILETRRAFYGGAVAMLAILDQISATVDEETAYQLMLQVMAEINEFHEGIGTTT